MCACCTCRYQQRDISGGMNVCFDHERDHHHHHHTSMPTSPLQLAGLISRTKPDTRRRPQRVGFDVNRATHPTRAYRNSVHHRPFIKYPTTPPIRAEILRRGAANRGSCAAVTHHQLIHSLTRYRVSLLFYIFISHSKNSGLLFIRVRLDGTGRVGSGRVVPGQALSG